MESAADLVEALEDELFGLRQQLGSDAFPRTALEYLNAFAVDPIRGRLKYVFRDRTGFKHRRTRGR